MSWTVSSSFLTDHKFFFLVIYPRVRYRDLFDQDIDGMTTRYQHSLSMAEVACPEMPVPS